MNLHQTYFFSIEFYYVGFTFQNSCRLIFIECVIAVFLKETCFSNVSISYYEEFYSLHSKDFEI